MLSEISSASLSLDGYVVSQLTINYMTLLNSSLRGPIVCQESRSEVGYITEMEWTVDISHEGNEPTWKISMVYVSRKVLAP